jgi:hypothetical protein
MRQGNSYDILEVLRQITQGTTDEWLYDMLGKKQGMITAFMHGDLDTYEDDDPADKSLEESQIYATNDKRQIEMLNLKTSLPRLEAQAAAAERAIGEAQAEAGRARAALPGLQKAQERLSAWLKDAFQKLSGDNFAITVGETVHTSRVEANKALIDALTPIAEQALELDPFGSNTEPWQTIGEVRGLPIQARPVVSRFNRTHAVVVQVNADAAGEGELPIAELAVGIDGKAKGTFGEGRNLSASITDRYNSLALGIQALENDIKAAQDRLARSEAMLASPSNAPQKVAAAKARIAAIEAELLAESRLQDEEAARAHRAGESARRQAGQASEGDFAEIPTSEGTVTIPLRPIEFPELVQIAIQLMGIPQVVKRFRKEGVRGMFTAAEGARVASIRLRADLFKKGNETQLAMTLAHEIGHLVDWLPDYTLTRGNLLGHLRSLVKFMQGTYTAADGTAIKNTEVREELKALSAKWRPWIREQATESFRKYRDSAEELYADALSVLLNNPGLAQADAPIFSKQFFEELDNKPEVKRAFFATWTLLSGTRDELVARREASIENMFALGNTKSVDILTLKRNARGGEQTNIVYRMTALARDAQREAYRMFVEKHAPFEERLKRDKRAGRPIAPQDDPFFALSERSYRLAGAAKAWLSRSVQPIMDRLLTNDLTWVDFGKKLMYDRILAGDRGELANPDGIQPKEAEELHARMMARLTRGQQHVLEESVVAFREAVKEVAAEAYAVGLYSDGTWKNIEANPAYSTFHTVEHLDDPVSSRIYKRSARSRASRTRPTPRF